MCEKCGEFCQCSMEPARDHRPISDFPGAADPAPRTEASPGATDAKPWRGELSARLNRYRTRHKAPPPRYPSLQLPFGPAAPERESEILEESPAGVLDSTIEDSTIEDSTVDDSTVENSAQGPAEPKCRSAPVSVSGVQPSGPQSGGQPGSKIIEFPGSAWVSPPCPPDPLGEPVADQPRILEVPEVAPPPPALGGITIDPARAAGPEKLPGIDSPRESAPLGRRLLASAIDGLIVGAASAFFGFIFWKVAGFRPPRIQLLSLAAGIPSLFWVVYQHLLIVYSGSTPGLRLARLRLTCFDGTPARRALRRWRVLASYLSAASLGMGYVWLFLDQDNLCWHDRITHTFLGAAESGWDELSCRGLRPEFTASCGGPILPGSRSHYRGERRERAER